MLSTNACMFWLMPQQIGDMFASLLSIELCRVDRPVTALPAALHAARLQPGASP